MRRSTKANSAKLAMAVWAVSMIGTQAQGYTRYWDFNGTTAGAGSSSPSGTWSAIATGIFNTSNAGNNTTTKLSLANAAAGIVANSGVWATGDAAYFSAGTDAIGSYTVTVSGTVVAARINVEDGTVTFAGTSTPSLQISGLVIADTVAGTTTLDATLGTVVVGAADQSWVNSSAQLLLVNSAVTNGTTNARTLTMAGGGSGGTTFTGVISSGGTGSLGLAINNTGGATTLSGNNTYSGATTLTRGTLMLDFSASGAPTTNIINNGTTSGGSALTLGDATLLIKGGSGATNSQRFNGTTFSANTYSSLVVRQNGAANVTATLGALTRSAQSTLMLTLPSTGTISTTTTSSNDVLLSAASSGVAYASVGGTTWATNTAGTIGALATYATDNFATATNNVDVTVSGSASAVTVNSLRFNTAGRTLTLGSGTFTLDSGGILVTPVTAGSSANAVVITGTGAQLRGATGTTKELVILNYGQLNVNVPIIDSGAATALTLGGTGTTTLNAANLFTGPVAVGQGTVVLGNATVQGTSGSLGTGNNDLSVMGAGVVELSGKNAGVGKLTGTGTVKNTGSAATLTVGNNNSTSTFDGLIAGGSLLSLTKVGSGTLNLGNNANTFGDLTVQGGLVNTSTTISPPNQTNLYPNPISLGSALGTGTITLSNGATITQKLSSGGPSGGDHNYGLNTQDIVFSTGGGGILAHDGASRAILMYSGLFSGAGKLTLSNPIGGTLDPNGMVLQHANNTYTGGTDLKTTNTTASSVRALFVADAVNALGGGTGVGGVVTFVNAGTAAAPLTANSYLVLKADQAIAGIAADRSRTFVTGYSTSSLVTLTLNNTTAVGDNSTFSGILGTAPSGIANITGSLAAGNNLKLVKDGTGTQVLTRPNLYTGGTEVKGGALIINGGAASGLSRSGTVSAVTTSTVNMPDTTGLVIGQFATNTPSGAVAPQIVAMDSGSITLSASAGTAGTATTLTFAPLYSAPSVSKTTTTTTNPNEYAYTVSDISGLVVGQYATASSGNFPSGAQIATITAGTGSSGTITFNATFSSNSVPSGTTLTLLAVSGAGTGPVSVNSAADNTPATLGGVGGILGMVTLNTPAGTGRTNRITGGTVGTVGTLNLLGGLTLQSGSTYCADFGAGADNADKLAITGAASVSGASLVLNQLSTPDQAKYTLATASSGLSGFTATGTPAAYRVNQGGTVLELIHRGTFGTVTANAADAAIIKGGSTAINFSVPNTAPTGSDGLSFSGSGTSNVIGSASGSASPQGNSGSVSGLSFSSTTPGLAVSGSFTVSDPNAGPSTSGSGSVTVRVWDHALPTFQSGTNTVDFGSKHVGYSGSGSSVTIVNTAGNYVPAKSSGVTGTNGSLGGFSGLVQGNSTSLTPSLTLNTAGDISETLSLSYDDDSSLNGAVPHIGVGNVTIQGHVYTGKSTWQGGSSWGSAGNWDYAGGIPGVDGNLSAGKDAATFGASGIGSVTLDQDVQLNSLALNTSGYTITTSSGKSITLSGSGAAITATGTQVIQPAVNFASDTSVNVPIGSTLTFGGNLVKNGTTLTMTGGGTINVNGEISGTLAHSDYTVDNATVYLNAVASYNGPTTITNSGVLNLGVDNALPSTTSISITNGSSLNVGSHALTVASLSVDATSILAGTGSVNAPVTIASGGTISPAGANSIGILSASSLSVDGTYLADLAGANSDLLSVTGALNISSGAILNLNNMGITGDTFVIAQYGTWNGTEFASTPGLPLGATLDYHHGIEGNEIAVVIPEPSTVAMVLGLSGLLTIGRRRRRGI